jgi:hypothetical protein
MEVSAINLSDSVRVKDNIFGNNAELSCSKVDSFVESDPKHFLSLPTTLISNIYY